MKASAGAFWQSVVLTIAGLAGMAALAWTATAVYGAPGGRVPALLVSVMRSREVLDNAGVTGYYERLFAKTGRMDKNYIYDRSFRIYRFRPNLTWEHDTVTTNSFGMVGPERSEWKPPHTRRVALLGDSITVGHMVPAEEIFGALLEARLNADQPANAKERFEILNFATVAYTLPQILDVSVEDAPRFAPDVYVLALTELSVHGQWDRHLIQAIQAGVDLKYDFLRQTVARSGVSRRDDHLTLGGKLAPYRLPVVREALTEMKANAASHGAPFVVLLVPSVEAGELSKSRFRGIPEILASLNIPVIDVLDSFDGILSVASLAAFPGDVHPNRRGHKMIFENLYSKLQAEPDAWRMFMGRDAAETSYNLGQYPGRR